VCSSDLTYRACHTIRKARGHTRRHNCLLINDSRAKACDQRGNSPAFWANRKPSCYAFIWAI